LWRELTITASIGGILLVVGLLFAIGMATRIARGEMLHDLFINELNHRVKNTLATVQSIASQTLRRTDNPAEAIDKFSARLVSLGRTHNVLSEEKWESAQVRELVDGALAPYAGKDGSRIHATGPDIRLAPRSALTVAMALHELATNAAKYGALAEESGRVDLSWQIEPGKLELVWIESDGPKITPPSRRGYGSRAIVAGIERQLGGAVDFDWQPGGLRCTLSVPHNLDSAKINPFHLRQANGEAQQAISTDPDDKRVLLVEDEPLVSMMLADMLSAFGHKVDGPYSRFSDAMLSESAASESVHRNVQARHFDVGKLQVI
jgi:two-component sensor histidine kinase